MNTCLLVAGAFFLVWLSDINSTVGIGGSMLILITSMVLNIPQDLIDTFRTIHVPWFILVSLVIMGLIFTCLVAILYRARYSIAVNKIGLHNRFKRYSYFEVMLNPAGGMPYMYVMTFLSLPTYLLFLQSFQLSLQLGNRFGFICILLFCFFLALPLLLLI